MFVDEAVIEVKGGDGGDGIASFRREKHVQAGGPDGGDGGEGGDVILEVDEGLNNLLEFREQNLWEAEAGENGGSKKQHGENGGDLIINVPPGTTVIDKETDQIVADLTEDGQQIVVAEGGRGGRGNIRFKNSTRQAPKFAENGEPGERRSLKLELKLLADVGLVGYPNVGKSTLISNISAAKPEVAGYHFTTLEPNLGVVKTKDFNSFVVADVPGLIEGAHEGVGLGDQFLQHLERTKVLVHVLDASGREGRNPIDDFRTINNELEKFGSDLKSKQQIIAANKIDLPAAKDNLAEIKSTLAEEGFEVIPISAATGEGTEQLIDRLSQLIKEAPEPELEPEIEEEVVIRGPQPEEEEQGFKVKKENGIYKVSGEQVERKVAMADLSTEEGLRQLIKSLNKMGIEDKLKEKGIKEGETVDIVGLEFEFYES